MTDQLSLPGLDGPSDSLTPELRAAARGEPSGYTLFFAVFPQAEDAVRLAEAALRLSRPRGLGKPMAADRLHVTLMELGHFDRAVPQAIVDAAMAGAAAVRCPPLNLVFDRALSFVGSDAFVLRCDPDSDDAIGRLRQTLAALLRHRSLRPRLAGTPHVTIAYGPPSIAEHAIEPIRWTATQFALILSHVGIGYHQQLGRWPLLASARRA